MLCLWPCSISHIEPVCSLERSPRLFSALLLNSVFSSSQAFTLKISAGSSQAGRSDRMPGSLWGISLYLISSPIELIPKNSRSEITRPLPCPRRTVRDLVFVLSSVVTVFTTRLRWFSRCPGLVHGCNSLHDLRPASRARGDTHTNTGLGGYTEYNQLLGVVS